MENDNQNMDIDGYEVISAALMDLLNAFPLLETGDRISFGTLSENGGKAMFPVSGSVIESESRDILGHTKQSCQYPFFVVFRVGAIREERKISVQEWLDKLGRWLEMQEITVGGEAVKLNGYPVLEGNRRFTEVRRTAPATLNEINENNTEDWAIQITARYINEF